MTDSRLKIDIRRKRILEQLRLEGKVSVSALCDALGVTPVTIRNDLTMLEQEGRLMRVQGGAVRMPTETAIPESQGIPQLARKQAIGQTVAQMVADGDTLFINSGTTCEIVAAQLSIRRNLNIVTNSLNVATRLGAVPTFRVLLLGGEINAHYGFTHGGDAQEQLSKYQADWAILSVDGISAKGGVTTHHAEEAVIDRMMAAGAKQRLIVADSTKIGKAGFSRVCESSNLLTLVTNVGGDPEALAQLEETGVSIRFSEEA